MSFQNILESAITSGFFKNIAAENAKAHGVLASAKISGRKPAADLKAIWAKCESPIETAMAAALCYAPWPCKIKIIPQHELGRYRLDFLVTGKRHKIDVECDGEEFHHHNISMEQWRNDRARDEFVERKGISVIRFHGFQIWTDAIGCADEVATLLANLMAGDVRGGD